MCLSGAVCAPRYWATGRHLLRRAGRVFALPESGADGHGAPGDGDFWSALPELVSGVALVKLPSLDLYARESMMVSAASTGPSR